MRAFYSNPQSDCLTMARGEIEQSHGSVSFQEDSLPSLA